MIFVLIRANENRPPVGIAPPGYRLPAATRVGHVTLQVADLERSLPFYENVLGLRSVGSTAGRTVLAAGGDNVPLVELVERPGARAVPHRGRLGLFHVAILLPERAALGRFVRHLANLGIRAGMSDHLVSEAVYLTDPDGLGIEVYADRPRDAWLSSDRQIVMTTAPLDVNDLLQSAGETDWTGVPKGTAIGHVHLHVGDLTQAAAFYHEALGLDKVVWDYPGALFLSAGGYHHHLGTNTWAASARPAHEDEAQLLAWHLLLPTAADVEAAAGSLEAAGYITTKNAGGREVADPWGTALRIQHESRER